MSTAAQGPATASTTPILDRVIPIPTVASHKRKSHVPLIAAIIAVLFPIACVALMVWSPKFRVFFETTMRPVQRFVDRTVDEMFSADFRGLKGWLLLLYPVLSFCSAIVIHEIGHLVFGLCSGLRLNFISFGPVRISSPFRISLKRNPLPGATGLTSMVPITAERLRLRMAIMIVGGPCANLATAFAASHLAPQVAFLTWYVPFSLFIGIGDLIPFRHLAATSDGMRLWLLLENAAESERLLALARLAKDLGDGVDADLLPEVFIEKAIAIRDDTRQTVIAHWLGYRARWDHVNNDEIGGLLEVCLQRSSLAPAALRKYLIGDAAVFQAEKRKRIDLAERWLADIEENAKNLTLRLWVQSAILDTRGDVAGALQKLDEYEKAVLAKASHKAPNLKSLEKWRSELRAKLAATTPASAAARHPD